MKKIVEIINKYLDIDSLADIDLNNPKSFRKNRIIWIENYLYAKYKEVIDKKYEIDNVKAFHIMLKSPKFHINELKDLCKGKEDIACFYVRRSAIKVFSRVGLLWRQLGVLKRYCKS